MVASWLKVLTNRQDIRARCPLDVVKDFQHLVIPFSDSNHDSGFGDETARLEGREHIETSFIFRLGSNRWMHSSDRFHVVADDLGLGIADHSNRIHVATKISNEHLDTHSWARFMDSMNRLGPDSRSAIGQFVTVDTCDNDMAKVHQSKTLRDPSRLVEIDLRRSPRLDIAEATGSRARIAEDHDCRRSTTPTLPHVWATRLLADRVQSVFVDYLFQPKITVPTWNLRTQPVGLSANIKLLDRVRARDSATIRQNAIGQTEGGSPGRSKGVASERSWMARDRSGNAVRGTQSLARFTINF